MGVQHAAPVLVCSTALWRGKGRAHVAHGNKGDGMQFQRAREHGAARRGWCLKRHHFIGQKLAC